MPQKVAEQGVEAYRQGLLRYDRYDRAQAIQAAQQLFRIRVPVTACADGISTSVKTDISNRKSRWAGAILVNICSARYSKIRIRWA